MSQAGDLLKEAGWSMPSFGGISSYLWLFLIVIIVGGGFLIGFYFLYRWLKFNKKILLFDKVGTRIIPVLTDRAQVQRLGDAGDYWFVTKKLKKILPMPKIQMQKNTYWFYKREDGEWINFSLTDIDKQMHEADVYYVDEDMRLQRLGIQKNLRDRLIKDSWWSKYGQTLAFVVFVVLVTVCLVVLFKEIKGSYAGAREMAQSVKTMAEAVNNLATRSGGGVIPV